MTELMSINTRMECELQESESRVCLKSFQWHFLLYMISARPYSLGNPISDLQVVGDKGQPCGKS